MSAPVPPAATTASPSPRSVIYPRSTAELAAAVRHAAATRRPVALQAGCDWDGGLEAFDGALLVDTSRMQTVDVDPTARRARVGAGVVLRKLQAAAASHGLAFLAGSSLDIGVVGYTLYGGVGWLSRQFGLACNTVIGAQVVTSEGAVRQVDAEREPELFWGLRGDGTLAAVSSLDLRLIPVREVRAGGLLWPLEQATEVLHCWRVWTTEVPDTVTSIARLLRYPEAAEVHGHLRGRHYVAIETVVAETEDDADIWLRPLRALKPTVDTITSRPCTDLGELGTGGPRPAPMITDYRLLSDLSEGALDTLVDHATCGLSSALPAIDIRHLGGAIGRAAAGHGALDRIDAAYALHGLAGREQITLADQGWVPAPVFGGANLRRLQAAKATYDPEGRFVSSRPTLLR